MAQPLRIQYSNFGGGINDFSSPLYVGENESPFAINTDFQVPGKLKKSLGYSQLAGSGGSGKIKGLFVFDKEDGTHTLLKAWKTGLYSYTGTGWNTVSGTAFTSGAYDVNGINAFVDGQERVYYTEELQSDLSYYNGTSVARVAGIKAKYLAYYKAQLYLGNVDVNGTTYPQRILFSPEGEDVFDTDNDLIDEMGEPITCLKVYGGYLYVFSENKVAKWDGYAFSFVPATGGTTSDRSVQESEGRLIWYNRSGVYIYGGADIPTKISKRVQGWIDVISDASEVIGGIDKFGRYTLNIGDVTYRGESFSDVQLIYDVLNNNWTVKTGRKFGVLTLKRDDGALTPYGGDIDYDYVYELDNGYALGSCGMDMKWETTILNMGYADKSKDIFKAIFSFKPSGNSEFLTVEYRTNGASGWSTINNTSNNISLSGTNNIETEELYINQLQSDYIEFKVSNNSTSGGWEIYSIDLEGKLNGE